MKSKVHNPARVTKNQLNPPARKYRFLDKDEIKMRLHHIEIECWCMNRWYCEGYAGSSVTSTYRTTLTRAQLAKLK